MRVVLTGRKRFTFEDADKTLFVPSGYKQLQVLYCAICRTDAKMWHEGHRDLVFPRVPGHEMVAADDAGHRYVIWPGRNCDKCSFCQSGRENLCVDMQIMGFHHDGGFARHVLAPADTLIPVPDAISSPLACLAEPTGCAVHALHLLQLRSNDRIIIYGGGAVGLMAALVCQAWGITPLVIEKNEEKIHKITPFLHHTGIQCVKDTTESEFEAALNACPDPVAFNLCTVKLAKGGRLAFFSGLKKNEEIETNLINLMHYKEMELHGAYGLTRTDMAIGLAIIAQHSAAFEYLIESIEPFYSAPDLMPAVLSGEALKFILDFSVSCDSFRKDVMADLTTKKKANDTPAEIIPYNQINPNAFKNSSHQAIVNRIRPVTDYMRPAAQKKIDEKTKPLGALGILEALAVQMSLIQKNLHPCLDRRALFVFAGDHGVAEEGVSAFPAKVTGEMVRNFLNGGAAINVLCRHHNIDMRIVDMGVNADFEAHPQLLQKKIRKGTRNFTVEEAMTSAEAVQAVEAGMDAFLTENAKKKIDIVGLGEMGIANTTSASAIISFVTGIPAGQATGRGTGVDDKGLQHKAEIIDKVIQFHQPDPCNGFDILCKIGGYEIAGIVGAALAATSEGAAVVLDGLISTAAGLVAYLINPNIGGYLFSGHQSVESAQQAALNHMGLTPIIDYQMRLGEGTGAAMAIDTIDAACRIMREMASFEEAGVTNKE
ncbi:MAG: nicotinate-nucleotide--dimethylbenzimidazole phosphoribosyltransferase [Desulfobacterales bacterium]|nr:nicotinate-nucleotide--dimethylbenzimidazole phosphoribosyltransferase [Desulfobacterales bacterium]